MLYRDYRGDGSLVLVLPQHTVSDDERGLLTWRPIGTTGLFRRTADGRDRRAVPFAQRDAVQWRLLPLQWTGRHVLHLFRPGRAHSVWWMFTPEFELDRWYVNLEAPPSRWTRAGLSGVDTFDHALDIVVPPSREWRWKDERELTERTGHPAYWTAEQEAEIRAEAARVVCDIEAARFPFDGTWLDFRPDPAWPVPTLPPTGWDHPSTLPSRA